jgi:6-phosphogluconolactonase/glucosamine-6-phosphate isomerase/deaminase
MTFYKTTSTEPAIEYAATSITRHLSSGQRVLWLLTGGSGIKTEVEISHLLSGHDLSNLSVGLTDERFPLGHSDFINHKDANWKQIMDAGFSLEEAKLVPVLKGKGIEATTEEFNKSLSELMLGSDYKIGLFGMGADGHTAGILPGSPAAIEKNGLACHYETADFIRITMTFEAIKMLDEAVLCAFGEAKKPALENLRDKNLPLNDQPAQILKSIEKLTIFNDQIGDLS